jgi:hypothetical protein
MPRFNFDLAGAQAVSDCKGLVFRDCRVAGRFAERLAADLGSARPDLCGRASVIMTDERRMNLTYCVAIGIPANTRGDGLIDLDPDEADSGTKFIAH